jgi:hypothetical protein
VVRRVNEVGRDIRVPCEGFPGIAGAREDGEGGVCEGARVELRGSPQDHRVVPLVSFERQEAAHVHDAIRHDRWRETKNECGKSPEERACDGL